MSHVLQPIDHEMWILDFSYLCVPLSPKLGTHVCLPRSWRALDMEGVGHDRDCPGYGSPSSADGDTTPGAGILTLLFFSLLCGRVF